nr:helix-turn-helix transcriptional regulator [uncultured Actinotalea sp.]
MATQTELVAGNIRAEMARRGVTQTTLAAALGKTQQTVSHKLSGRGTVTVEELHTIAAVLGVAATDLLPAPTPTQVAS